MKQNCWEFKKCGREPGGAKAHEMGVCPSATFKRLDGVHDGLNAGRACWIVGGTMCCGKVQGTFAMKYLQCSKCDFYLGVIKEEGRDFVFSAKLLEMMNGAQAIKPA